MSISSVHEAKTNLSRLIAEVLAGGDVVITRNKKAVARLVPMDAPPVEPKQRIGSLKGKIAIDDRFFEPLPDEELAAWEGR